MPGKDAAVHPPTRVVLGVSGGIAAYKAAHLLRLLTESGHDVQVVPTASALEFVGEATWTALSGHPLASDVWTDAHRVPHVSIGREADLVVVAPATADLLAKAAHGLADDLLTNVLLTATCPVVMAPAMHTEMWEHPATQHNVATLRERGVIVLEPATGRLTGRDSGKGRLPEPEEIAAAAAAALVGRRHDAQDLAGLHVVVSSGGTREHLDPVRFLGNRSSGRQGHALAAAALARGAQVSLVAANTAIPAPAGATVIPVVSAEDLREAVLEASASADVVVMAAAVADFRPAHPLDAKLKKGKDATSAPTVVLERTPDVLVELVQRRRGRSGPIIVGFAAETGDAVGTVLEHAATKLTRKGCDLLVVNDVGPGGAFESPSNEVWILSTGRPPRHVARADKLLVAHAVLDAAVAVAGR
jgi:phosphopantothenoylcysteine decarboxylase/phosphopantothenate--cysteine ligase